MIAACHVRGVSHLSSAYMSPLYSKSIVLKTWESRFEPILDPSHWPEYNGREYIPDRSKLKDKVGMRKKKWLRNEMDQISGYGDDIYGYGDFNQDSSKVQCSICHKEGHRMEKHKQGPKNLPKNKRKRVCRNNMSLVRKSL